MKLPALLLASAALLTTASAQLPDPAELLGLRLPTHHQPLPAARVSVAGDTVLLHLPGRPAVAIYRSEFNLRGALTSPDGKLVAIVQGTGSAGDWITFLHRIDQSNGSRFIAEPLHDAVHKFLDLLYSIDPDLQVKPARLRLTPVTVFPSGEFQFTLTGDNDLLGHHHSLVITETAQPVIFEGYDQ